MRLLGLMVLERKETCEKKSMCYCIVDKNF